MSTVQQINQNGAFGSLNVTGATSTGSLVLPTTGGVPTPLTYYEEYTNPSFVWNSGSNYTPTSVTLTINIVRVGRMVTMHIPAFSVTGNGGTQAVFISNTAIPSRFVPASGVNDTIQYLGVNNGTTTTGQGSFVVNRSSTSGILALGTGYNVGAFANTLNGTYGLPWDCYVSWSV